MSTFAITLKKLLGKILIWVSEKIFLISSNYTSLQVAISSDLFILSIK